MWNMQSGRELPVETFWIDEVSSTQDLARQQLPALSRNSLTVFAAKRQTAGRGRSGRSWISEGENLAATLVLFLPQEVEAPPLSLMTSIAICKTLEALGFHPQIKWPNDLLLHQKKAGGVLCEVVQEGDQRSLLCGIGLNVNMPLSALEKIPRAATSLAVESGHLFSVEEILETSLTHWKTLLRIYLQHGFSRLHEDYCRRLAHRSGDRILFHRGQESIAGTFQAVTRTGALLLQLDSGEEQQFYSGEI